MGQKTNPTGFRLAVRRNWQSRWYAGKKDFGKLLYEDQIIRAKLNEFPRPDLGTTPPSNPTPEGNGSQN